MKQIYECVIAPIIMYGVGAWGSRAAELLRLRNKLNSIQRGWLLAITRRFRTAPTEIANILAGIPPISLSYDFYYKKFLLRSNKIDFYTYTDDIVFNTAFYIFNCHLLHPRERRSITFNRYIPVFNDIDVYTDGSGLEGKIGLAFVVFYRGLEIKHAKFKLEKYNSVYQAELIAIQKALEWLVRNLNESQYNYNTF
ncbi:uncharacterized protein LOC118205775 [Stegodyphus dumicola]|uniref:uncharacterized protein LOC118205775 n=1 Tax=Stegodyphus dumicola TaxID=202533 RepID=UPI0015AF8A8E|nr:uncharacterized protein LOC118205775 [Stegodyphus dumicola]